jgi:ornithine decarboxylase
VVCPCTVYGRRDRHGQSGRREVDYWVSDGIYGSLNGILYDHTVPKPVPLHMADTLSPGLKPSEPQTSRACFPSTLFGPTCDGADVIVKDYMLPELAMGDWVLFPHMGAYSIAGACDFNGFKVSKPPVFYVNTAAE